LQVKGSQRPAMRILIVEDERKMAELLRKGLEEEGHSVTLAYTGTEGLQTAESYEFDVIVLDVMLPGIDGYEVTRRLRQSGNRTPILILTARDAVHDVVKGLDLGADDYLTKPFSFSEFLARLRATSRRGPVERPASLRVGDLLLDPASHEVCRKGKKIDLTKREYALLEFLMRNAGRVMARTAIIEAVWGFDQPIEDNTLEAFIRLLRMKIDRNHKTKLIQTIRGFGYLLRKDLS
jgi:DNA-binding response OmpR family regulator